MSKSVYTTHDVAKYCHVTMTTVVNWIEEGSLKAYKTKGGHRRIKKNDLLEFLRDNNMPISLNQSILVVDDDASIRSGLKKLLEKNGYLSKDVKTQDKINLASAFINDLILARKFPQKMITTCIKNFSEKKYTIKKFSAILDSLSSQIEMLEFSSIPSFEGCDNIPDYLKRNLMTVNSGLYVVFFAQGNIVRCNYCWYTPRIINNSNLSTLISSGDELFASSMMHFTKLLDNYNKNK